MVAPFRQAEELGELHGEAVPVEALQDARPRSVPRADGTEVAAPQETPGQLSGRRQRPHTVD